MTKIIDALREKFRTPQAALRALGLDENLLREDETKPMSKKDEAILAVLEKAMAQDASLGDITKFVEAMTALESGGSASGSEGAVEEEFGEHEDEDGEDEIPGAVTEPNAGLPAGAEGEEHEGEEVAHDEPAAAIHAILKDKCSPEELAQIGELLEKIAMPEGDEDNEGDGVEGEAHGEAAPGEHEGEDSEEDTTEGQDEDKEDMNKDLVTRPAMDEAIKAAVANAEKRAAEKANALRAAERAVEPYVGKLALDAAIDADGVYRHALTSLGVEDAANIHPSAFKGMLKLLPLPGSASPRREPRLAQDAAAVKATLDRFPNAGRLKRA
jgi:hypothetical protein